MCNNFLGNTSNCGWIVILILLLSCCGNNGVSEASNNGCGCGC